MAESLQKLVESLQEEISNLRAQVSSGRLTAQKDLFQFPLNPSGQGQKIPLV
jgi:ribosomal protein L29